MKPLKVDSVLIYERAEDKTMLLRLTTQTGMFEFELTPERWREIAESAKWFEKKTERS